MLAPGPDRPAVRRVRRARHPAQLRPGRRPPGERCCRPRRARPRSSWPAAPSTSGPTRRCSPRSGGRVGVDAAPAGPRDRGLHRGADPRLPRQPVRRRPGGRRRRLAAAHGHQRPVGLAQNPRMLSFIADLDMERVAAAVAHRQHDQPGRAVPGDPRLLDGPREPTGVGRPGRRARPRHHGAVGRGHHARDGVVGDRRDVVAGPHSSSRSPTRSPVSPPRRSRSNNACTPSAAGACWCAPRRGCSGSSTRR